VRDSRLMPSCVRADLCLHGLDVDDDIPFPHVVLMARTQAGAKGDEGVTGLQVGNSCQLMPQVGTACGAYSTITSSCHDCLSGAQSLWAVGWGWGTAGTYMHRLVRHIKDGLDVAAVRHHLE
jgi:hypothetical protein